MIRIPSKATLKKYGLTESDYIEIIIRQEHVCPVCKKTPKDGKFVIDHYHHPRYKDLPAHIRKAFVRGATCWFDNYYILTKGITVEKAENVVAYLKAFEARRPK